MSQRSISYSPEPTPAGTLRAMVKHWMFRTGIDPFTYAVRLGIILLLVVFFLTPLIWLFIAMTKTNPQLMDLSPLAIGSLGYIRQAWGYLMMYFNGIVLRWIANSVNYVVMGLILSLFTAIPAGFVLAIIPFRARKLVLWITLIMMLVPGDALVLPMYLELFYMKLINTPWALIVPASSFPVGVYLTFQYFKTNLPPDLVAAAKVDGCSNIQIFRYIGLPLAKNIIGVLAFTNFAALWSNFFGANILIDSQIYKTLPAGISIIVSNCGAILPAAMHCISSPDGHQLARAEVAILGVISTLPVLVIYLLAQRLVIRGATAGAIKE
jgi:multiple sugar transport system permease protein